MPAAKPACAESWKPSMTVGVNYCTKLLEWNHNRMSTREETKQRTHEIPTTWGRPERLGEWSNKRVSKVVDFSCCLEDLFCINCWSFAKPQEWRATRKTFWFCPCAKNKKRFLLTQRFQALSVPLQPSFVEGLAQLHEACKFQLTDLAPVQPKRQGPISSHSCLMSTLMYILIHWSWVLNKATQVTSDEAYQWNLSTGWLSNHCPLSLQTRETQLSFSGYRGLSGSLLHHSQENAPCTKAMEGICGLQNGWEWSSWRP